MQTLPRLRVLWYGACMSEQASLRNAACGHAQMDAGGGWPACPQGAQRLHNRIDAWFKSIIHAHAPTREARYSFGWYSQSCTMSSAAVTHRIARLQRLRT